MTDAQDDDELTRRFKAVFNKEPVSQGQTEPGWKSQGLDDYEIDDEEVKFLSQNCVNWESAWKVGGGECCVE